MEAKVTCSFASDELAPLSELVARGLVKFIDILSPHPRPFSQWEKGDKTFRNAFDDLK